jgi:exoribonuclease R
MVAHRVAGAPVDYVALRDELAVPGDFAYAVLAEAERAVADVQLPAEDATDIPFVTVDPPGSRDLDQAVHIAADGDGYLVSYAIADVAAFVRAGSPVDDEARRRGETLYFPDKRVPLHPPSLSEGAASLLPGELRPAVLWQMRLDASGEVTRFDVRRARVRSRAQLDYATLQKQLDTGSAPPAVALLEDVGARRAALALRRNAINLDLPEQEVVADGGHRWTLTLREPLPVESWNAEISLLTGMCAAQLMLRAGVGILRTVPEPSADAVAALRRAATALGIDWPHGAPPGQVLARVDRGDPRHVAFIEHAVSLLRGAGYTAFDGAPPTERVHAGVGGAYAHVTAPLRRLVDRFGSEICLAAQSGAPLPRWVRERLPELPQTMADADHLAHEIDRAVIDSTEAWLLRDRVGERFAVTVVDAEPHAATVVVDEPAIRARCTGDNLPVGEKITATLAEADIPKRLVRFQA